MYLDFVTLKPVHNPSQQRVALTLALGFPVLEMTHSTFV